MSGAALIRKLRARMAHVLSDDGPRLLRDLASLLGGQALSMVIGFVAFAWLARRLGTEDYGALEFAISLASFAAILIECGAGTIGAREIARAPERSSALITEVPVARFLMALWVVPLVGVVGQMTGHSSDVRMLTWLYALSLLGVVWKQEWLLQGTERMALAALAQPIRTLVFAVGVFVFVSRPSGDLLVVGWIEVAAVATVTAYYLLAQRLTGVRFSPDWTLRDAVRLLREGFAVGMANVLWGFMLSAPMVILVAAHRGTEEAAWLGAAQRIVVSLMTVSFVYHFNLYPVIVRTLAGDMPAWSRLIESSSRILAWGGVAVALLLTVLSEEIMVLVFGGDFRGGAEVLTVLAWVFPLRLYSGHARWSLIAMGRQKELLWSEIAGAVALVVVGALAAPSMGAAGAALAFAAAIVVSAGGTHVAVTFYTGRMAFLSVVALPLASAIGGLVLASAVGGDLVTRVTLAVGVFLVAAILSGRRLAADLQRVAYAKEAGRGRASGA